MATSPLSRCRCVYEASVIWNTLFGSGVNIHCVQCIPIIEVLLWFRGTNFLLVQIHKPESDPRSGAPHTLQIHLVMPVEWTRVKHDWLLRVHIGLYIPIPEITIA